MGTFLGDLRFGARMLRRAPAFTVVAILTLALGIGANTAIFSIVNALLLRPLPYPDSGRLVMVWQDLRGRGGPAQEWATPGNIADWQASGIFAGVTAIQGWQAVLTGSGEPEPLPGEMVTHQYFSVLGTPPQLGRGFQPADDVPNAARVVVLGHSLWERRFGADPAVIGRMITLGGEVHEVIGVMPAGFRPGVVPDAQLWRPRRLDLANPSRGAVILRSIARLDPGRSLEQSAAAANDLASRLAAQYPEWNRDVRFTVATLHSEVVGDIRPGLLLLLGAVAFVMLIACANIANLLLARASTRGREMAVRLALGAGKGRIVRQVLTESMLLALVGGAFGLLVGVWGISALVAAAPAGAPRVDEIGLDLEVLGFAAVLTGVTALIFGIVPALHAARMTVAPALKEGGRATSQTSGLRARRALIVFEVAVAMALLVAGGLLTRTLAHLQAFDLGFSPAGVLVGQVTPARATYPQPESVIALYDRLLERASALPGVETAALTSVLPLGGDSDMDIVIEGRPEPANPTESTAVWYRLVSSGYFRAMGIDITRGRAFEPGEAAPAVIVSEAAARRYWGAADPIGKRVRFGDPSRPWFNVVGVAREVHVRGARGESRAEAYLPVLAAPGARNKHRPQDRRQCRRGRRAAAPGGARDRSEPAGGASDADDVDRRTLDRAAALHHDPGRPLRRPGAVARGGRHLRADSVHRGAADAGDRRPHRPRRQPPRGPAADSSRRRGAGDRRRRRRRRPGGHCR